MAFPSEKQEHVWKIRNVILEVRDKLFQEEVRLSNCSTSEFNFEIINNANWVHSLQAHKTSVLWNILTTYILYLNCIIMLKILNHNIAL